MKKLLSMIASAVLSLGLLGGCGGGNSVSGTSSSPLTTSSSEQTTSKHKLHIATTTGDLKGYTGFETEEATIRGLYEAGFRYIDYSMYGLHKNSEYMQAGWEEKAAELLAVAEELDMQFVQAHSPGGNPLSVDTSEVDNLVAATIRSIEICELLGIENNVVHPGYREGFTKEQWFEANKAFYERILPTAERCGVNVLCENSTSANLGAIYWANSGEDMREFVEYVNHPNFHACWDTGHANCEGSQYDDIMALGDELYAIHYHDNQGADTHEMPYCGTMDNDEVMQALVDVGYSGYFTFEADGENRAQRRWNGPGDECPIFEDLYPDRAPILAVGQFTRLEQEILLYQIGEYLLSQYGLLAK